jgi:hypothetical protein
LLHQKRVGEGEKKRKWGDCTPPTSIPLYFSPFLPNDRRSPKGVGEDGSTIFIHTGEFFLLLLLKNKKLNNILSFFLLLPLPPPLFFLLHAIPKQTDRVFFLFLRVNSNFSLSPLLSILGFLKEDKKEVDTYIKGWNPFQTVSFTICHPIFLPS